MSKEIFYSNACLVKNSSKINFFYLSREKKFIILTSIPTKSGRKGVSTMAKKKAKKKVAKKKATKKKTAKKRRK